MISGRACKTHGKGVPAIFRAAFNLALPRHYVREERPFPNLVLIDSPLVVYEKPDAGEPFSDQVVDIVEKKIGRYRPIRQGIAELTETLIKLNE